MPAQQWKAASFFKRCRTDEAGSVAVEFAIGASFALALIFSVVDVGRLFIVSGLLGDAVRQISRDNQVRPTPFSAGAFSVNAAATLTAAADGLFDANTVSIATTVYDDFDALAANTPDAGAPPGGDPGQIVKYRLTYLMSYYTPFIGMLMDVAAFNHVAEIIVYNEPELPS